MLAKVMSVGFFPPIFMSFVHLTPALRPFGRKKKLNLKRLWAATVILKKFSLIFWQQ